MSKCRILLGTPPPSRWSEAAEIVAPGPADSPPPTGWALVEFPAGERLLIHEARIWRDGEPEPVFSACSFPSFE